MEQGNQPKPSGRGPVNGHYRTFSHALAIAMQKCFVWRETENGTPYTAKELLAFAQTQETEHPLQPEQYYMVSREGAIGLSPGLEWMTTWMFIPMEPCKERDFAFRNMMEELHTESEVEKAIEKAVQEGLAREKAAKEQAATAQPAPDNGQSGAAGVSVNGQSETPAFQFCPYCGAQIVYGAKFCGNCGNHISIN